MKRSQMRARRATPRTRTAPRWTENEWADADALLQARAGGRCECCGKPLDGRCERHHRARRRDGGDRVCNLLVLLPSCHAWWTVHPEEARARGIIVSAVVDPAVVPVLWRGSRLVLLDEVGGKSPAPEGCHPPV